MLMALQVYAIDSFAQESELPSSKITFISEYDHRAQTEIEIYEVGKSQYCQTDRGNLISKITVAKNGNEMITPPNADEKFFCVEFSEKNTYGAGFKYGPYKYDANCTITALETKVLNERGGDEYKEFISANDACLPNNEEVNFARLIKNSIEVKKTAEEDKGFLLKIYERNNHNACDIKSYSRTDNPVVYTAIENTMNIQTFNFSLPYGKEFCIFTIRSEHDYMDRVDYEYGPFNSSGSTAICQISFIGPELENKVQPIACTTPPKSNVISFTSTNIDAFDIKIYEKDFSKTCYEGSDRGKLLTELNIAEGSESNPSSASTIELMGNQDICLQFSKDGNNHYFGPYINDVGCTFELSGNGKSNLVLTTSTCKTLHDARSIHFSSENSANFDVYVLDQADSLDCSKGSERGDVLSNAYVAAATIEENGKIKASSAATNIINLNQDMCINVENGTDIYRFGPYDNTDTCGFVIKGSNEKNVTLEVIEGGSCSLDISPIRFISTNQNANFDIKVYECTAINTAGKDIDVFKLYSNSDYQTQNVKHKTQFCVKTKNGRNEQYFGPYNNKQDCAFTVGGDSVEYVTLYDSNSCTENARSVEVTSVNPENFDLLVYQYDEDTMSCDGNRLFKTYLPKKQSIYTSPITNDAKFCINLINGNKTHEFGPYTNKSDCKLSVTGTSTSDVQMNEIGSCS